MTSILGAPFNAGSDAPMTPEDANTLLNQLEENITYIIDVNNKTIDNMEAYAKYDNTLSNMLLRYTELQDRLKDHKEYTTFMENRGKAIDAEEKNKFCKTYLDSEFFKFEVEGLRKDVEIDRLKIEVELAKREKTSAAMLLEEYRDDVSKLVAKVTTPIGSVPVFQSKESPTPAPNKEKLDIAASEVQPASRRPPLPSRVRFPKPPTKVVKNVKDVKRNFSRKLNYDQIDQMMKTYWTEEDDTP